MWISFHNYITHILLPCNDVLPPDVNSTYPPPEANPTLAIAIGSVCAAVTVLLLVVAGIVIFILIKKCRMKEAKRARAESYPHAR